MAIKLRNSLFIHVPKTAGRTVTDALLQYVEGAENLGDRIYDAHSRVTMGQLPTFGLVRHPYAFLKSLWLHRARKQFNWQNYILLERECGDEDFEGFLDKVCQNPNCVFDFYMFYLGGHRNITIGKVETLQQDLIQFLEAQNESFDLSAVREALTKNIGRSKTASLAGMADREAFWREKIIESEPLLAEYYNYGRDS